MIEVERGHRGRAGLERAVEDGSGWLVLGLIDANEVPSAVAPHTVCSNLALLELLARSTQWREWRVLAAMDSDTGYGWLVGLQEDRWFDGVLRREHSSAH